MSGEWYVVICCTTIVEGIFLFFYDVSVGSPKRSVAW